MTIRGGANKVKGKKKCQRWTTKKGGACEAGKTVSTKGKNGEKEIKKAVTRTRGEKKLEGVVQKKTAT